MDPRGPSGNPCRGPGLGSPAIGRPSGKRHGRKRHWPWHTCRYWSSYCRGRCKRGRPPQGASARRERPLVVCFGWAARRVSRRAATVKDSATVGCQGSWLEAGGDAGLDSPLLGTSTEYASKRRTLCSGIRAKDSVSATVSPLCRRTCRPVPGDGPLSDEELPLFPSQPCTATPPPNLASKDTRAGTRGSQPCRTYAAIRRPISSAPRQTPWNDQPSVAFPAASAPGRTKATNRCPLAVFQVVFLPPKVIREASML